MLKIKISEIFYSIQGEGHHTGMPAVFVRFAGCNLRCSFCDTKRAWHKGRQMTVAQILKRVEKYKCKNIIITGGEPTLQKDGLLSLCSALRRRHYYICLETNGTIRFDKPSFDWITISPKTSMSSIKWLACNELKVVYRGQSIKHWLNFVADHYYLQPCSMKNIKQTTLMVRRYPRWRLSLQCQKLICIR